MNSIVSWIASGVIKYIIELVIGLVSEFIEIQKSKAKLDKIAKKAKEAKTKKESQDAVKDAHDFFKS